MAYTFPTWLYLKAVAAVFSNKSGAPELLIRVVRRIAPDCETESIIGDIERRDLAGVQRALQTRRYSVFDTMFDGTSMILLALMREDIAIVGLLLAEGADVFQEDDHGNRPYRDILMQIYASPHLSSSYRQELERLMPIGEIIEATELPDLHKVVIGILCLDIRGYLRTAAVDVAATDVFGRSALWYASSKGELGAVQALLDADTVQPGAAERRTKAIHIAARHNHVAVLRCLLDHGTAVSVDCRTMWSFTPLMSCAQGVAAADDTARELVRRGADVDAHNLDGTTALHVASMFDRASLMEILVAGGADIDRRRVVDGATALATAIQVNSRRVMETLLRLGADIHVCDAGGQGVGHLLGKFADGETLEVLRRAPWLLAGLDAAAEDAEGKTAMDICLERQGGLSQTFGLLLEAVHAHDQIDEVPRQRLSGSHTSLVEDEDDDVFFEAPEMLGGEPGRSKMNASFTRETTNSASLPFLNRPSTDRLHDTTCDDGFIDENKYRFPEHTNSNGTKATDNMRMEHLER